MRNDYIGTSIDGDARAACPCRNGSGNNGHSRPSCSCQGRSGSGSRQPCNNHCSKPADHACDNDCRQHTREDDCACSGRTPAMVYAQHQNLDSMYRAEKALLRGTLFGCLDKPMCGERCTGNPCTSQSQEDKFTLWELRLYLDTHPNDQKALALFHKLTEQMEQGCGCAFYPDCNRWSWLDGPWPWEYQHCCGKEA